MGEVNRENDLKLKLESGEYKTIKKDGKSAIWKKFNYIVNSEDCFQKGVQCNDCGHILIYDGSKTGSSHLSRHVCKLEPLNTQNEIFNSEKNDNEISVSREVKKKVLDACVVFCAKDLRPFETVAGVGFLALAQTLIDIGADCGKIRLKQLFHIKQRFPEI